MEIELSSGFLRKAKKLEAKDKRLLSQKIEILKNDSDTKLLKIHPLTGKLKGLLSFSLTYSKRVIFMYVKPGTILLIDVGTHNEVYKN